jgi:hypothetical protein
MVDTETGGRLKNETEEDRLFSFSSDAFSDAIQALSAFKLELEDDMNQSLAHVVSTFSGSPNARMNEIRESSEITVSLVSKDELEKKQREIESGRLKEEERRASQHAARMERVRKAEELARKRVLEAKREFEARVRYLMTEVDARSEARAADVHRAHSRALETLVNKLKSYEATVRTRYGRFIESEPSSVNNASSDSSPTWSAGFSLTKQMRVLWKRTPQPLEFRVSRIRAVKNKLPDGLYVLMVTAYSALGGAPMRWSGLHSGFGGPAPSNDSVREKDRPSATAPLRFKGRFYDTEMTFNQCIYNAAPAGSDLLPHNCFVFELFLLGGRTVPMDRVVAWSVLPASDANFTAISGRFRIPMLRGEYDPNTASYFAIEDTIGKNLDSWLGNLYVEVSHLPRLSWIEDDSIKEPITATSNLPSSTSTALVALKPAETNSVYQKKKKFRKVREWDVELAFTSSLLRVRNELRNPQPLPGKGAELPPATIAPSSSSEASARYIGELSDGDGDEDTNNAQEDEDEFNNVEDDYDNDDDEDRLAKNRLIDDGVNETWDEEGIINERQTHRLSLRNRKNKGKEAQMSSSSSKNLTDSFSSTSTTTRGDISGQLTSGISSFGYALKKNEASGHGFHNFGSKLSAAVNTAAKKWSFFHTEIVADLRLGMAHTLNFWIQFIQCIAALWLRMYVHYLGQYIFLRSINVPVYSFTPLPYTMTLKYVSMALPAEYELVVILLGPVSTLCAFLGFCVITYCVQKIFGRFPDAFARFIAFFGVFTVLDSILIVIVDAAAGRFNCSTRFPDTCGLLGPGSESCTCSDGDAFRLYSRFDKDSGGGAIGIVLTIIVFFVVIVCSLLALYLYTLFLHMNGRMMDIYRRLNGLEDRFRIPDDMEISAADLTSIIERSRQWKGVDGQCRRVAIVTSKMDLQYKRTIYTINHSNKIVPLDEKGRGAFADVDDEFETVTTDHIIIYTMQKAESVKKTNMSKRSTSGLIGGDDEDILSKKKRSTRALSRSNSKGSFRVSVVQSSPRIDTEIQRELYRYFVRKQDHTIVEVFGGIDKEIAEKARINL